MRRVLISIVLLSVLAFVPTGNAAFEIANSVTGFSGVQGQNGWTYEVLNNSVMYAQTWDSVNSEWTLDTTYSGVTVTMKQNASQGMKDKIGGGTMQGVGTVRRYTADRDYTSVVVSGTYDIDYALTRHYKTAGYAGSQPTAGAGTGSYSFTLGDLDEGDWIYFYIFCYGELANDPYDSVYQDFNMVLTGIPEPATIVLLSLGGLLLRRKR
jgi:hypothetical protein